MNKPYQAILEVWQGISRKIDLETVHRWWRQVYYVEIRVQRHMLEMMTEQDYE